MEIINKDYGKIGITIGGTHTIENTYEELTIVYSNIKQQSYISKKDVPARISIDNEEYWQLFSTFDVVNVREELPIEGVTDANYSISHDGIPKLAIYKVVYSTKFNQVLAVYNGSFYTDWEPKVSFGYNIPTRGAYTNLNNIAYLFNTSSLEVYYFSKGKLYNSVINKDLNIINIRLKQVEEALGLNEEAVKAYVDNYKLEHK